MLYLRAFGGLSLENGDARPRSAVTARAYGNPARLSRSLP